jgi:hypothetical protein
MIAPLLLALAGVLSLSAKPRPRPAPKAPAVPSAKAPAASSTVRILAPGTYAKAEVAKDAAGVWWALVKEGDAYSVRHAWVKAAPLALAEARPRVMDGVEITTPDAEDTVLLVRGLKLEARPVPAAEGLRVAGDAAGDQKVTGAFQGEPFEFWSEPMGERTARAILRLKMGTSTHALLVLEDCDDCTWDLLWAGDLDGDGRLDALLGTTHPRNKGLMRLYLSGKAKVPALAALAATHAWDFGD